MRATKNFGDLTPLFPLPAPGDQVLIEIYGNCCAGGRRGLAWCTVTQVDTGRAEFYPVCCLTPCCGLPARRQQGEIEGWRPT